VKNQTGKQNTKNNEKHTRIEPFVLLVIFAADILVVCANASIPRLGYSLCCRRHGERMRKQMAYKQEILEEDSCVDLYTSEVFTNVF
jgi:hypothetical protein